LRAYETIKELRGKQVPLEFHPLLRYHAVGLLRDLIPVSMRADVLLRRYKEFIA